METSPLRLVLEIDPVAEPVAGTVRGSPDTGRAFTGWTQLGHVLGAVIAEARERSGAGDSGDDGL